MVTQSNDRIYFAIEKLEDYDKNKWIIYRNQANMLINGGCCDYNIGSLIDLATHIHDDIDTLLSMFPDSNYWLTPSLESEYSIFNKLRKSDITSKKYELMTIPQASYGMNIDEQTHIVYASKSPITGRINFNSKSTGFQKYMENYGDLIMSVGVTIRPHTVENRGIFRNPLSIIEGGYKGISMMMHKFTCIIISELYPEISMFRVRPLKKMGEIFIYSLRKLESRENITINGVHIDNYNGDSESEIDVKIPIVSLIIMDIQSQLKSR
jgi:hypothetical protein